MLNDERGMMNDDVSFRTVRPHSSFITHHSSFRSLFIALIACLWLAACATLSDRDQQLEQAQRLYEGALRWGHYDIVYALHDAGAAPPRMASYRVTSTIVQSNVQATDREHVEQVLEIRYYHIDYMQERTLVTRLLWAYDAARKRWHVTSPPPEFKEER